MSVRTVVVTDGDERAALAVVRSLGAIGYRCVVVSATGASIAGASRFAARESMAPSALERPAEFARAVAEIVATERAALLIPTTEASVLALLPVRDRLVGCVIPLPDEQSFRDLSDKQRVLDVAARLGIAVPSQVAIPDAGSAAVFGADALQYPVVLKPARSVGEFRGERAKFSVAHAADTASFRRAIAAFPPAAFPLLVQQRIVGPGVGVFLLLWNGTVRAEFAHRRLAEKPPWGGVSVYRESIAMDRALADRSVALLTEFGWRGVAMVEYKTDAATGTPYLMEVNGRFWGSLQLAIDAGVNFPRVLAEVALGETPSSPRPYRIGIRSRWWWGQVDHLVARLRPRPDAHPLPPGTVSAFRAAMQLVLGPFRAGDYEEVYRWRDARPFWRESARWLRMR